MLAQKLISRTNKILLFRSPNNTFKVEEMKGSGIDALIHLIFQEFVKKKSLIP